MINTQSGFISKALNMATVALVALSLAGATSAAADRTDAETLSLEDGLSQTTVFAIHDDREGTIWFGTEDGLNRYDGQTFTVYRHDRDNPASLPANTIRGLAAGTDGRIWVATEGGGVAAWDPATDEFVTYRHDARTPSLASNYTRAVELDNTGMLWVATRDKGVDRLDPVTGEVRNFRNDKQDAASLASDKVYELLKTRDGRLFVGTNEGLDLLDSTGQGFEHIDLNDTANTTRVRALYEDSQGMLWVGTRGSGLFSVDLIDGTVNRYRNGDSDRDGDVDADDDSDKSLSNDDVQTILEDDFGQLWVGTANGLNQLDRLTGHFDRYGKVDISATGGSGSVTTLHADSQGSLWVGTELGGLIHWKGPDGILKGTKGRTTDIVTSFTQDRKGSLYFGTVGKGMAKVRDNGRIKYYRSNPESPASLSDDRVMSMLTDSRGRIWVGTMSGGLNQFSPGKQTFKSYKHDENDPSSISANGIMTLHEDPQGNLWVGTFGGGLNYVERKGKSFTAFRHDPDDPNSLSSDRITAILGTESGLLWVGTDGGGLNLYDPTTGVAQRFSHDPLDPNSLPADTVCALFIDAFGALWVGTRGGGIAKMIGDPDQASFLSFTEADGLPNSVVYAIQPDSDGTLWLSTNNGLSRFDPVALTFDNYNVDDGLQANEFNFGASYRSATGELFFGGIKGYNSLAPQTPQAPAPRGGHRLAAQGGSAGH